MERSKLSITNEEFEMLLNYGNFKYRDEKNVLNTYSIVQNDVFFIENTEFDLKESDVFDIGIRNNNTPIQFQNCKFSNILNIKGNGLSQIKFVETDFDSEVLVDIAANIFIMQSCIISDCLTIKGSIRSNFVLRGCQFKCVYLMAALGNILIDKSSFSLALLITKQLSNPLHIYGSHINQFDISKLSVNQIIIKERTIINELTALHTNFLGNLIIDFCIIKLLRLENVLTNGYFLKISRTEFLEKSSLNISGTTKIKILDSPYFNKLMLSGKINTESSFEIKNSILQDLDINSLKNEGVFKLSDIKINRGGYLRIINSYLGKAEIHQGAFSNCFFEFDKSQISEIFISETDFPKKVYLNGSVNYGQGKLAFGQLQTVFQKQGDSVRSYEYLAREIKCYYHQLNFISSAFFTKLNLFLNYISNDFGRNWIRGIIFSFGIGLLFYYILLISTSQFAFGTNIYLDPNYIGSFLKFMNPLRHFETETLFDEKKYHLALSNYSYIWDFLGRLFVAYGYFQTIQAFRKFGKK